MKKGWEVKKLGQVCEIFAGQSPQGKYYNNNGEGLPFYQGKKEFTNKFIGEPTTWTTSITREALKGDILMSVRAPVGPINFATRKICIGRGLAAIRVKELLDREFLFNFLLKNEKEITGNAGAVFNSISKTQIEDFQIPLPPLPEQKRIVKVLDEAFAALNRAKENTEKNLQSSRELFESYLNNIFANPGPDWEGKKLGEVSKINYGYTESASNEAIGPKFLRITDIQNNTVDWKNVPYCKIGSDILPKYRLSDGDIVFARTGATTGKSYLVKNPPKSVFASYLIRLRLNEKNLLPEFLSQFFQTHLYWSNILSGVSGSTQGSFNATKLGELIIYFPQLLEQKHIVAEIDSLSAETKKLEVIYQQKLADIDELKKSILHKAFNGELTGASA